MLEVIVIIMLVMKINWVDVVYIKEQYFMEQILTIVMIFN